MGESAYWASILAARSSNQERLEMIWLWLEAMAPI
jgi:hypothetical protein